MKRYLLDTHVLLWWLYDDPKLSLHHRETICNPENKIFVSVASIWEIEIKMAIKKLIIDPDYMEAIKSDDFELLSINAKHALQIRKLPIYHNDPFDRILIAQTQTEKLILLTVDNKISNYDVFCA